MSLKVLADANWLMLTAQFWLSWKYDCVCKNNQTSFKFRTSIYSFVSTLLTEWKLITDRIVSKGETPSFLIKSLSVFPIHLFQSEEHLMMTSDPGMRLCAAPSRHTHKAQLFLATSFFSPTDARLFPSRWHHHWISNPADRKTEQTDVGVSGGCDACRRQKWIPFFKVKGQILFYVSRQQKKKNGFVNNFIKIKNARKREVRFF